MGSAKSDGVNRAQEAITKALDSPLLNDNKIRGAKNVLLLIVYGDNEITIDEIGEINDYIQSEAKSNVNVFMGVGAEKGLGDSIEVTIVATGFNEEQQTQISTLENKKVIYNLEEEVESATRKHKVSPVAIPKKETPKIVHQLIEEEIDPITEKDATLTLFDLETENISKSENISGEDKIEVKVVEKEEKSTVIEEPVKKEDTTLQGFFGNDFSSVFSEMKKTFPKKPTVSDVEPKSEYANEEKEITLQDSQDFSNKTDVENLNTTIDEKVYFEEEETFVITPVIAEIEVYGAEKIEPIEDETKYVFDLPIGSKNTTNEITPNKNTEEIRYGLEDYDLEMENYVEHESNLINAKADDIHLKNEEEVEFKLEKRETKREVNPSNYEVLSDVSPMNSTIMELRKHTDKRRNKLKQYNHQFNDKTKQSID